MNDVHFSSKTDEWATPIGLFQELDKEFHFTLDPCANDENHKCDKYYTKSENGLEQDWGGIGFLQSTLRAYKHRCVDSQVRRRSEKAEHHRCHAHPCSHRYACLS